MSWVFRPAYRKAAQLRLRAEGAHIAEHAAPSAQPLQDGKLRGLASGDGPVHQQGGDKARRQPSNISTLGTQQVPARVYLNSVDTVGVVGDYSIVVKLS